MKKVLLIIFALLMSVTVCGLVACGGGDESSSSQPTQDPAKSNFVGVVFSNETIDYDGSGHTITAQNVPSFAKVDYTNNGPFVNAGTYNISVTITADNYNDLTLNAKLVINKISYDMTSVAWNYSEAFTYDGSEREITVTGLPSGVTVVSYQNNKKTNAGSYTASATLQYDTVNHNAVSMPTCSWMINKASYDMTSAAWNYSEAFTYDGSEKEVTVTGLPSGVTVVSYQNNKKTNAGSYTASATLQYDTVNHNAVSMPTCSWVINKAEFEGITFSGKSFEYDGLAHSISITGNIPVSATVTYTSNVTGITNSATEIGIYNIQAKVSDVNFNDKMLNAVLKITVKEVERYMSVSGNTLFFQNALDDNKLYAYNFTDKIPEYVSGDNALDIIPVANNKVVFVSSSVFSSAVKSAEYNTATKATNRKTLFSESLRYVQYVSDDLIYYVQNGLTKNSSGIFKADLSGEEPITTCLSVGRAKFLQLYNNKLYFSDTENGGKLSSINTTTANQNRAVVVDKKINNLMQSNGVLYFTVNELLGDYIAKYTVSTSSFVKLTSDAGINLCIANNELYYINVDKFSTSVYGNGIYKVAINTTINNSASGTKVIDGEESGICSLISDGSNLYYYDMDGYKLIQYSVSGKTSKNLLDGFVKPEPPTPLSKGSQIVEANGLIYYLDIWDDKTLHSYNPQTKANIRLTADKVENFSVIGDYVYFNSVSFAINNDLYRINTKSGASAEKVNKYDASDMVSDGTYLYYIESNAAGVATAIHKSDLNGENDSIIYSKGVSNLRLVSGALLFIDGYQIFSLNLSTTTVSEIKADGNSVHTTAFDTDGTYVYYRDMFSIAYINKQLTRIKLDGTDKTVLVSENVDPIEIKYVNGKLYYYSDTTKVSNNGLYSISISGGSSSKILGTANGQYAMIICVSDTGIYFVDYKLGGTLGDAHLYFIPTVGEIVKIA